MPGCIINFTRGGLCGSSVKTRNAPVDTALNTPECEATFCPHHQARHRCPQAVMTQSDDYDWVYNPAYDPILNIRNKAMIEFLGASWKERHVPGKIAILIATEGSTTVAAMNDPIPLDGIPSHQYFQEFTKCHVGSLMIHAQMPNQILTHIQMYQEKRAEYAWKATPGVTSIKDHEDRLATKTQDYSYLVNMENVGYLCDRVKQLFTELLMKEQAERRMLSSTPLDTLKNQRR